MRNRLSLLGTWLGTAACAAALLIPTDAAAQIGADPPNVDKATAESAPLFSSIEPLKLTLVADFKQLRRDRDHESEYRAAKIVLPSGDSLPLQVQTRGNFRLNKKNCTFPPLRLNFKKGEVGGTLFEAQDKLKLVVTCQETKAESDQHIFLEYLAYRVYNQITDMSFRARLAEMTYVDTSGDKEPFTRWAFMIEDFDHMVARAGWHKLKLPQVPPEYIDPDQMMQVEMFHYLIGSTDWDPFLAEPHEPNECCHNQRPIGDMAGPVYTIPYDFDMAGLVNAPYAVPDKSLSIRKVRDRLYRGLCRPQAEIQPTLDLFNSKKDAIYGVFDEVAALDPAVKAESIKYLDEFFATIGDNRRVDRELTRKCRKL